MRWPAGFRLPTFIQQVKTNGVLTPLLWTCGLNITATCFCAYIENDIKWLFGAISACCVAFVFRSFEYFRDKNPQLLQSEDFQIKMAKQLQIAANQSIHREADKLPKGLNSYLQHSNAEENIDV